MFELLEALDYEPASGALRWKAGVRGARTRPGSLAGCINGGGYIQVQYRGKRYLAHRIAWFIHYRVEPLIDIDHIDGNPSNNAIFNLRLATDSQNRQNQKKARLDSKSGLIGAGYSKTAQKFSARIVVAGKRITLGYFDTAEEAHGAYLARKRQDHPYSTI